jgi:hypothetical protein
LLEANGLAGHGTSLDYLAMYLKNGEAAADLRAVNDALERTGHTLERRRQDELLA